MTRFPFAALLLLALALPPPALAQSETRLDDAQRAAIRDFFKKPPADAAEEAQKAKPAGEAQATDNGRSRKPAKAKRAETPKKPAKSTTARKDKGKAKTPTKADDGNAESGGEAKPAEAAGKLRLARGQLLAPDLPRRALPRALDSQLGKPAPGTQRVIVGDDVVLFERKTGRILDVVEDAVAGGRDR